MATGFNTQVGNGEYRLQFRTDKKEHYLLMQETARRCIDEKNKANAERVVSGDKQSPCETCKISTNPAGCQKKHCKDWKEWWLSRWELIQAYGEIHKA